MKNLHSNRQSDSFVSLLGIPLFRFDSSRRKCQAQLSPKKSLLCITARTGCHLRAKDGDRDAKNSDAKKLASDDRSAASHSHFPSDEERMRRGILSITCHFLLSSSFPPLPCSSLLFFAPPCSSLHHVFTSSHSFISCVNKRGFRNRRFQYTPSHLLSRIGRLT